MKYLKAFEASKIKWYSKGKFSKPENLESDFDDIEDPLKIVKINNEYYLIQTESDSETCFFKDSIIQFKNIKKEYVNINDLDTDNLEIEIYDKDSIFSNKYVRRSLRWNTYRYKDLPEEIKNRII